MNFFKALFGGHEETPAELEQKKLKKNFDILKYDGIRAQQSGQMEYAVRCFVEALKLQDDAETESHLAQTYLFMHQPEQAYEVLCHLSGLSPDSTEVWLSKARVALSLHKLEEAEEACKAALQLDDANALAHYQAAQVRQASGDVFNAIASLTKAVTLRPELEDAYRLRAEILQGMGQLAEAEADADYLLEHFAPTEEALLLKAGLRQAQGQTQEAIRYYDKVKAANPFNESAYIRLSQTYAAARRMDASLQVLEEGLEMMPQSAALYKERGRIKLALGDKEGSMDDLKKVLELSPEEAIRLQGQFTNLAQEMEAHYKSLNPYGF